MSKSEVKHMIDLVSDEDVEVLYKVLVRLVPSDEPTEEEKSIIKEDIKNGSADDCIAMTLGAWE